MNIFGTQWCVLNCRQHAVCHSYWASLSFLFCNPNEISGKWQDLSFPKSPHKLLQLSEQQVTNQKATSGCPVYFWRPALQEYTCWIHWLMKHFSGWALLRRCNETALPYALPMSHCLLQVSKAGLLHLFINYHWTSDGNKPCGLLRAFSAVAYTSRQNVMMQLFFFYLSFVVESATVSQRGAYLQPCWMVTGEYLAILLP